jgi:RNA polymerase sigma factor (sigma-70 family)
MTPLLAHRLRPDRSFERLYRRHAADVYRYALALLRNPADAEDVTQTTFLNAYRVYQRGERPRSAHNWLIAIAHNVCRQRFRQSQRRVEEVALDEGAAHSPEPDESTPSVADIQRALGNLAFNQRSALVMRELEGRSYAEIGEALGLSRSAVETLIFRARRALREQLDGSLTCADAERAISRQLDGELPRAEKGVLRAHLRECPDCASLARRQRAQRAAFRGLASIPLPPALASLFGGGAGATAGGSAVVGGGLVAKAAVVVTAGVIVGGAGYKAVTEVAPPAREVDAAPAVRVAAPSASGSAPTAAVGTGRHVRAATRRAAPPVKTRPGRTSTTGRASRRPPSAPRPVVATPPPAPVAAPTAVVVAPQSPPVAPAREDVARPTVAERASTPERTPPGLARAPGQARAKPKPKPKPTKTKAEKADAGRAKAEQKATPPAAAEPGAGSEAADEQHGNAPDVPPGQAKKAESPSGAPQAVDDGAEGQGGPPAQPPGQAKPKK